MALTPLGLLDLSVVTDALVTLLNDCIDNWPLWAPAAGGGAGFVNRFAIAASGSAPDSVRTAGGCQLSMYLFHVAADPYQRNAPVVNPRNQPVPAQPLSLQLYYLLSAFAGTDFHQEQQAMSIAMRCLHAHPIVRINVPLPITPAPAPLQVNPEEFTLTLEVESVDTLSRFWQSAATAVRLAAVYKASVVFLTPPAPAQNPASAVQNLVLAVDPARMPIAAEGQLIGTLRRVTYASPLSTVPVPDIVSWDSSIGTAAADQTLFVLGAGLSDGAGGRKLTASRVYLLAPDGTEQDVSGWLVPDVNPTPPPAQLVADSSLTLRLPLVPPAPGVYQLRVGCDVGPGVPTSYRSNSVPLCIAAAISGLPLLPAPPILAGTSIQGQGFLAQKTALAIGGWALTEGPAQAGNFQVVSATRIDFALPAGLPAGLHAVRLGVNGVESDPSWWIQT